MVDLITPFRALEGPDMPKEFPPFLFLFRVFVFGTSSFDPHFMAKVLLHFIQPFQSWSLLFYLYFLSYHILLDGPTLYGRQSRLPLLVFGCGQIFLRLKSFSTMMSILGRDKIQNEMLRISREHEPKSNNLDS